MVSKNWNLSNDHLIKKEINRQIDSWKYIREQHNPVIALLQEVMFESLPKESINKNIL
jgi:hypothetical protein